MADIAHRPTIFVVEAAAGSAVAFDVPGNAVSVRIRCRRGLGRWSDTGTAEEPLSVYSEMWSSDILDVGGANFQTPLVGTLYFDSATDEESEEDNGDSATFEVIVQ